MKSKGLRSLIFSILVIHLAAQIAALGQSAPPVVLPDGSKLSLLGATYGTHHVPPGYEITDRNVQAIDTPSTNSTVVWLAQEHDPGQWYGINLSLSDAANTETVSLAWTIQFNIGDTVSIHGFLLKAFPRWEKEFVLSLIDPRNLKTLKNTITVKNPHPVPLETFKTEPLPATKSDEDLKVTLTKLETKAPLPFYQRQTDLRLNDPQNRCVRIGLELSPTNWEPLTVVTSDALGNSVFGSVQFQSSDLTRKYLKDHPLVFTANDDYQGYYFKPGLWPEEPAWKIRLEFMRTSDFDTDEILSLTDIPVRAGKEKDFYTELSWKPSYTNWVAGDYAANGIQLKLLLPLLLIRDQNDLRLRVVFRSNSDLDANKVHITVLKATDDQGRELESSAIPPGGTGSLEFVNVHDMKTFNLKLAVHRSRFVEFNVKPTE